MSNALRKEQPPIEELRADNSSAYCKVPIKYLVQFEEDFLHAELFIKLNDEKFVRLTLKHDDFGQTLETYRNKGLTDVYLTPNDFKVIFTQIKERITGHKQFYNPTTVKTQKMVSLEQTFGLAKEFIAKFGIDEVVIDTLKSVNIQSMKSLKQSPNIFQFFKDFKDNCSEEFLKCVLVNHLVMLMIDKFSWRSNLIKEKATMASFLCDITLSPEEFKEFNEAQVNNTNISDSIKKHPATIAALLREKMDVVSLETITIVEQHHEKPDGSGFPYGHGLARINQLSAIYITAARFIDKLVESEFDYEARHDILDDLYADFHGGTFDKSFEALNKVVNED